jgi:hypothetical protein
MVGGVLEDGLEMLHVVVREGLDLGARATHTLHNRRVVESVGEEEHALALAAHTHEHPASAAHANGNEYTRPTNILSGSGGTVKAAAAAPVPTQRSVGCSATTRPTVSVGRAGRSSRVAHPSGSTRTGMTNELVAKPMPMTTAAGFSRKLATVSSSSACTAVEPASMRLEHAETPYVRRARLTAGVQIGSRPPKPR